ncbi:MAG: hypothetical protein GWP09_01375 [Nitrospiraceae bacterium]|nr:hypothetical protein [Nitrospiraceae bacterium]
MNTNKILLLKELIDLSWKSFDDSSADNKKKVLNELLSVLWHNMNKIERREETKWLAFETRRVLIELIRIENSERALTLLHKLIKINSKLNGLTEKVEEQIGLSEEVRSIIEEVMLRVKTKSSELKSMILMKNFLNTEKKILSDGETRNDKNKALVLRVKRDLNRYIIDKCDKFIFKINLWIKESKDNNEKIKLRRIRKDLLKLRESSIEQTISVFDKNAKNKKGYGTHEAEILDVKFFDANNQERKVFKTNETFIMRIHYKAKKKINKPMFGMAIYSASNVLITGPNTTFSNQTIDYIKGEGYVYFIIKKLPLLHGKYLVSASIYDYTGEHPIDHHHQEYEFSVVNDFLEFKEKYGLIAIEHEWSYENKKRQRRKIRKIRRYNNKKAQRKN